MKRIVFLLALFIIRFSVFAQLSLPSIFRNDMVLQQQSDVAIWGKGKPGEKINIKTGWDKKAYKTTINNDSIWFVRVRTPKASFQDYNILIQAGKYKQVLRNILIGEVWLCSGQSNMDMRVKGYVNQPTNGSQDDIVNSTNNFLRCYTLKQVSSIQQKYDCPGSWEIASPNTTGNFSATAYYFGRLLQKTINVPVGIIHCSWGGSTIEAWMSPDAMKPFPELKIPVSNDDNRTRWKTPTVLYNGMLSAVVGYGMRGAIWYQGESNRTAYQRYAAQFSEMHNDWIKKWDIGEFPIYFCQLAPYKYGDESKYNNAFMREVQQKIAQTQPNTGMAVLMDVGDELCIHPANKKQAGERLAYIALGKNYGFDKFSYQSPEYKSIEIKGNKLTVRFNYASDGLTSFGRALTGFEIAGADKVFYPADATLIRVGIELTSPNVPVPVAVRYAFKDYIGGTLFGVNGLPVSSFRSDDWDEIK
jgi:sialate O-acetylesterase